MNSTTPVLSLLTLLLTACAIIPEPSEACEYAQILLDAELAQPAADYLDAVVQGWSVHAKKRPCFLRASDAAALRSIESYQYTLRFECPQGFEELVIRYALFGEQWRGEQNFTRVFMAGDQPIYPQYGRCRACAAMPARGGCGRR